MSLLGPLVRLLSGPLSSSPQALSLVKALIRHGNIDPATIYYQLIGVKVPGDKSGEDWFIPNVLVDILSDIEQPVLLDVGANVGDYALALIEALPRAHCYSFEPNPKTFKELENKTNSHSNIHALDIGIGSKAEELPIFYYDKDQTTEHASLYSEVLTGLHQGKMVTSLTCKIDTIDHLCQLGVIPEKAIHFIKLDTEGHELDGIKGAADTLASGQVRVIQFEFNEMNVISRIFLKDFYDLLAGSYRFFRLDTQRLIPLRWYRPEHEIFKYQNIICIRSDISDRIFTKYT